jgi:hypothetical protein
MKRLLILPLLTLAALAMLSGVADARSHHSSHHGRRHVAVKAYHRVNYRMDGNRWDNYDNDPNRVQVVVRTDGGDKTYYFDNLAVAHSWLYDKYGRDYKIVSWQVPSNNSMVDATSRYYVWHDNGTNPITYRVFDTRDAASEWARNNRGWAVVDWKGLQLKLGNWRTNHWSKWHKR